MGSALNVQKVDEDDGGITGRRKLVDHLETLEHTTGSLILISFRAARCPTVFPPVEK